MNFARAQRRRNVRAEARSQKEQPPAYIDLVEWVRQRAHISRGRAAKVILAGSLKVDSHTIGVTRIKTHDGHKRLLNRYVPADLRGRIEVVKPEWMD